jgi:hypothetical protein
MRPFEKYTLRTLLGAILLLGGAFASCTREDDVPGPTVNRNTLLMYVVGDNNISDYMQRSVNAVVKGLQPGYLLDNTLLIYVDASSYGGRSSLPQLLEVVIDPTDGGTTTRLIAEYPEQNSADIAVLDEMIEIMQRDYSATEGYGLMISSHATGWLPGNFFELLRGSRAIGQDRSNWIEIDKLVEALPDHLFDYILFDACYMASVEVAYALRDKADYIIATPTELWAEGMPYNVLGSSFFGLRQDPIGFCDALYEQYDNPGRGSTVSLIETARMDELATLLREVLYGRQNEIRSLDLSRLQTFGTRDYTNMFHDLDTFVEVLASEAQYAKFRSLMEQIAVYNLSSPTVTFPDGVRSWSISRYCGLSTYIPKALYPRIDAMYADTDWAKAIYQ